MSGPPPPNPHGSKRLQDEVVGSGCNSGNHNSALGPSSLKYPPPHVNDSSSGMGVGGGYPPPPLTTTTTATSTTSNVVGPKLTTNDHYHSQPPFDQVPTGIHRQPQQQQQPLPPAQSSDRWSAMIPMYQQQQQQHHQRTPPVDSHPAPLENRLESRGDFKGADKETTRGSGGGAADSKEVLKYDRDRDRGRDAYHPEIKVDEQKNKGYAGPGINWKESKDHYRVDTTKRYANPTSGAAGNPDTWGAYFSNLHRPVQDGPSVEERDHVDPHEAVGENKIDLKSDDRYKEKDRKRKDLKARDWGGERDKDRERRNNLQMQLGGGSGEGVKEPSAKEEREADKWDREKKDPSKDTEKSKEREKDSVKRETWNGGPPEKDGLNSEKEPVVDMSGRTPERETSMLDQKKQKEHDGWKSADREGRERRKERDGDVDTERPEKRIRCYDKESDDGCAEPEGGTEKEREGFGYGVQQRKRMLRPRGSPQVGNRESRFRSRAQDNEGTQGKPEVSSVVYRVGECMQELMKLWKDYESSQADKNGENAQDTPTLEIRIPAEYITATNRQVRGGQLWGTDVYTGDSDLVAVLMHTGYCRPTASPPPPAIQELRATVKVLPPQDCYTSTLRNNVRSRAWGAAIGCSYCVEHCCIFKKGGGAIDLEPCLTHTSTVEPTLAPVAVERTMTTRAAASNALRQQRFVREVTIQYNLCNEPWIKYSLSVVADKGLKKPLYTSARLKKGEVLYLETHSRRYELCFTGEKMVKPAISSETQDMDVEKSHSNNLHSTNGEREKSGLMDGDSVLVDVFRWSRCKRPLPLNLLRSSGIPLPAEHLEVLEENLDWEDIKWSQTGVFIAGKEYAFARLHFMSPN